MALVCDVYLCFCHFPMWYPESGVVLDCIVSESLPSFLLRYILLANYVPYLLPLLKHKECLAHMVASYRVCHWNPNSIRAQRKC